MKIYIGTDHNGVNLKNEIVSYLQSKNVLVIESEIENTKEDDYPDFAFDIANKVAKDKDSLGILLCGNGIGMSIAANKVKNIRCARIVNEIDAYHAKTDDQANMISFGGVTLPEAIKMIETFINTESGGVERFDRRTNKILAYENGEENEY